MKKVAAAVATLGLIFSPSIAARALAGTPLEELRVHVDRVLTIMENPDFKGDPHSKERAQVRKILRGVFDFEETAKRSLARHWHSLRPEEQSEFVRVVADLVVRSYVKRIEEYRAVKIAYVDDAIDRDEAVVRTRITTKSGTEVPIDYRMLKRGERWRVYDLIMEGVSTVVIYQMYFSEIIERRWRDLPPRNWMISDAMP